MKLNGTAATEVLPAGRVRQEMTAGIVRIAAGTDGMGLQGAGVVSEGPTGSSATGFDMALSDGSTMPQHNNHAFMRAKAVRAVLVGRVTGPIKEALDDDRVLATSASDDH